MSSIIGHGITGLSIYLFKKPYLKTKVNDILWLFWLIINAIAPDFDYIIPFFHPSHHNGIRITHSIAFALFLPIVTIFILVKIGIQDKKLKRYSVQLISAGLSHLILDLLVGVTALPLLYPLSLKTFKLPFGILPSAGKIHFLNFFFYRNLFIEMSILIPLYYIGFFISQTKRWKIQQIITILILFFYALIHIYWSYSLSR